METRLGCDEAKRQANLRKHGLDFADAGVVLESRYRLEVAVVRNGEVRMQSFSYVLNRLEVLTVVHLDRVGVPLTRARRPPASRCALSAPPSPAMFWMRPF